MEELSLKTTRKSRTFFIFYKKSGMLPARFEYALQAMDRYLLENTIVQQLAESIALPQHIMMPLLQRLIPYPSDSTKRSIDVFLDDLFINADPNIIWTAAELNHPFVVLIELHKIALLINELSLKLSDIEVLMAGKINGIPDFNDLPVHETATVTEIDEWIALFNLVRLNKEVFNMGSSVFEFLGLTQENASTKDNILHKLSEFTGWKLEDLQYLTDTEGLNLLFPQDYMNGNWLIKIGETLKLIDRIGATARQMASWTSTEITKTHADSVRHAAMAKYGETQWQEITVPLRNNIRESQRDALVQYVLHYCSKNTGGKFEDTDDIYGYYLIDTQMAACTDTSRIVLAASSVQLFVQRIMMNLEDAMSLTPEFIKEWKWRKYYRVWEANRKVFMWSENWIEPELRDDKTPLFKELENELLQGELNSETVEKAYVNYLEKLHEVSHLRVCGMYHEPDAFHVIAHTSGTPESYYYRRWENKSQWTAWEKIELDIFNGEEIETTQRGILMIPLIHNNRLFLLWPLFIIKKEPPTQDDEAIIDQKKEKIDDFNSAIRKKDRDISRMISEIDILKEKAVKIEDIDESLSFIDLSDYVKELKVIIDILEDNISDALDYIKVKKAWIRKKEEQIRKIEQ